MFYQIDKGFTSRTIFHGIWLIWIFLNYNLQFKDRETERQGNKEMESIGALGNRDTKRKQRQNVHKTEEQSETDRETEEETAHAPGAVGTGKFYSFTYCVKYM